jgi:hypothetical protein
LCLHTMICSEGSKKDFKQWRHLREQKCETSSSSRRYSRQKSKISLTIRRIDVTDSQLTMVSTINNSSRITGMCKPYWTLNISNKQTVSEVNWLQALWYSDSTSRYASNDWICHCSMTEKYQPHHDNVNGRGSLNYLLQNKRWQ